MKRKFMALGLLSVILAFPIIGINAKEGQIDDSRVNMIYWDRWDWNVFYTGVTNKLDYQQYAPCVGVENAGFECGKHATQGRYEEFGLSIMSGYRHVHLLADKDYYRAYQVNP